MAETSYEVRGGKAIWNRRPLQEWVDDLRDRIVNEFDPAMVILFGSVASGTDGPDSDIDMLVVVDTPGLDRRALMVDLRRKTRSTGVPRDLIVTSLADFDRNRRQPGTIERESAETGRVIHDRRHAA